MKLKKNMKIGMTAGAIVLLAGGAALSFSLFGKNKEEDKPLPEEKKNVKIVDVTSKSRPYAVMINNVNDARELQSGLQDAYLVYELTVEGGITRLEALYKDKEPARLGSIRSSRPYYLDYAMENDAIYVHWGYSEEAKNDISTYGINNINGLVYGDVYFKRDQELMNKTKYEYTAITSMELLKKATEKLNYRTTTDQPLLLNYIANEVKLSEKDGAKKADNISIVNSASYVSEYKYDAENKVYLRSVNGTTTKDYVTKEQHTVKNIITYQVQYTTVDAGGHQKMDNIGSGEGYYISNGYAVPIKWEKKSRAAQTSYKYLDGTPIEVNDGNTWIHIQQKGNELKIS